MSLTFTDVGQRLEILCCFNVLQTFATEGCRSLDSDARIGSILSSVNMPFSLYMFCLDLRFCLFWIVLWDALIYARAVSEYII